MPNQIAMSIAIWLAQRWDYLVWQCPPDRRKVNFSMGARGARRAMYVVFQRTKGDEMPPVGCEAPGACMAGDLIRSHAQRMKLPEPAPDYSTGGRLCKRGCRAR